MVSWDSFLGNTSDYVPFTEHQLGIIDKVVMVSCSLGMLGSVFMVITYLLFKEIREFSTKLICLLSLSDFMTSLLWFPYTHSEQAYCLVQSIGLQFFLTASFLWTVAISFSLLFGFYSIQFDTFERMSENLRYYNAACWGVPLFFVGLTTWFGKYANNGNWCFIAPDSIFRMIYYVPLVIVFIINATVFVAIRVKLARHKFSLESRMNVLVSFYLVAFLVSQLPAVINGFQHYIVNTSKPVFALNIMIAACQPLQGFLNAVVYGFNEGFIAQYIYFFEKHCGRRLRRGERFERDEVDTDGLLVEYNYHSDDE